MLPNERLVTGNAYADGAERGGWFIARFVDPEHGLRCRMGRVTALASARGDFEVKLIRHAAGDAESRFFPYNSTATTTSVLVGGGRFELYFCADGAWQHVILSRDGDYAIWAPGVGHRWIAREESKIITVRCPGVDAADQAQTALQAVPPTLVDLWNSTVSGTRL